jgi:sugar lactone lactonase YvrE
MTALLLGLGLFGCGGGSGDGTSTSTTPPPVISPPPTVAGNLQLISGHIGGKGNGPSGIALDASGNLYLADTYNHDIRKITPAGVVTTLAGTPGVAGSADGTAGAATFNSPSGIAVDIAGNVYVADNGNFTIRKITSAGMVTTLAGQAGVSASTDGTGSAAHFCDPLGVAVDTGGNVYVVDGGGPASFTFFGVCNPSSNAADKAAAKAQNPGLVGNPVSPPGLVRKITPSGVVTTLAGASAGQLNNFGIALDAAGNLYVSNRNVVNKVSPVGVVTTLANGISGLSFDGGIAVDAAGNLYSASIGSDVVSEISQGGAIGNFPVGSMGVPGSADGVGPAARFNAPSGIAVDAAGNVYVVDSENETIRKITQAGVVTTFAGTAGVSGNADGAGAAAQFNLAADRQLTAPQGITLDAAGNLYITNGDATIKKIAPNGATTVVAGSPFCECNLGNDANGVGAAAQFFNPRGITVDAAGNLFVADTGNALIRMITPAGVVTTLYGNPFVLGISGPQPLYSPLAVTVDTAGNLYITELDAVIKIAPGVVVTTRVGTPGINGGSADGIGAAAQFSVPLGIAMDTAGNLYVADTNNNTIRKIALDNTVTTLAGSAGLAGSADGTGPTARFSSPAGIVLDAQNNLYVADSGNGTIRKITPAGVVTTVAGVPGKQGLLLGTLPAGLDNPTGLALIDQNTLAVTSGSAVLKLTLTH